MVAGGVGTAPVYPIARAFHEAGSRVITIQGARSARSALLDRPAGRGQRPSTSSPPTTARRAARAWSPSRSKELLEQDRRAAIGCVYAIGPAVMMKFCAETTRPFGVKTIVSLNSIMVDGTGMCGGCRVDVGGQTRFTCVDGPEFDGHLVDWDELFFAAEGLSRTREAARWTATSATCRTADEREGPDDRSTACPCPSRIRRCASAISTKCRWATRPSRRRTRPQRCLQCKKPACVEGCPVQVDIPGFVGLIAEGQFRRGGAEDQGNQLPAGGLRPRLPAGNAVRSAVHPGQEGRAGGRSAAWSVSPPTTSARTA